MRTWIAAAGLLAASLPAVAQPPGAVAPPAEAVTQAPAAGEQPQPPVFGVGVDMVAVDASVVDGEGRPVLGLGPEDFRVEVDGKPRRLVSVEYVGRDLESPAPPRARPAHFSCNEDAPGAGWSCCWSIAATSAGARAARCSRPRGASSTRWPPATAWGSPSCRAPGGPSSSPPRSRTSGGA